MVKEESGQTRGERLKRLRKAKSLSLEQVHQMTKIHLQVLKALEDDKVDEISLTYVKGLLKIYCNLLGVDPKDFMQEEEANKQPTELKQEAPKKKETMPEAQKKILDETVELALTKPRINISVITNRIKLKPVILSICVLILVISVSKIQKSISVHRQQIKSQQTPTAPKVTSQPQEETPPASEISVPRLGIRAKQDCWLEVKADGKTIFRNILQRGNYEYWEAKEKIEFSLGNAAGVDVEVNGKLLPPLGRRGQVIRNIRITRQGLVVPE
jgi:cytoskeletal protein RodZ